MALAFERPTPAAWAEALAVPREAIELYLESEVIDLHIDSFIWTRIFGYDLTKRHGHGALGARFYSQVDLPRIREAGVTGGIWVITTNPLRGGSGRATTFARNLERLRGILDSCPEDVAVVRTLSEFRAARARGLHAAFIGVQGGNAVDGRARREEGNPSGGSGSVDGRARREEGNPSGGSGSIDGRARREEGNPSGGSGSIDGGGANSLDLLSDLVVRVTLVHLSNSGLGKTSAPGGGDDGLSEAGRDYVRGLDARRIFVDLAHINRRGFFEALEVHDKSLPCIVTHTGISGVHPHWRNLDDEQVKAIADTGGTIGVMFHSPFLGGGWWGGKLELIVDHLEHIIKVAGEDFASLGSDWDGAIVTPRDMPTCLELPRLVAAMLTRGWRPERIQKVLGGNWLRTLGLLRP